MATVISKNQSRKTLVRAKFTANSSLRRNAIKELFSEATMLKPIKYFFLFLFLIRLLYSGIRPHLYA